MMLIILITIYIIQIHFFHLKREDGIQGT